MSSVGKRKRHDDERRRCQGNESQIDAGVTRPATRTPRFLFPSTLVEACHCLRHAHYNRRFLVRRSRLDLWDLPHYDSYVKFFWRGKCWFAAFHGFFDPCDVFRKVFSTFFWASMNIVKSDQIMFRAAQTLEIFD